MLFHSFELIPNGKVEGIRYLIFVDPIHYREIGNTTTRLEIGRVIGRLNKILEEEQFILIGPGRWGSTNIDLGVRVSYADIFNTRALVEMAVPEAGNAPDLSYGTHFFQDLVEGGIYPLPLHMGNPRSKFDWEFFREAPNALPDLSPRDAAMAEHIKVVDLQAMSPDHCLTILMDGARDEAVAFLEDGACAEPATTGGRSLV